MTHGSSLLAHQFTDMEQQRSTATLGMWAFLLTEIMFFGGLFGGYTVYRLKFPLAFAQGSHHLDIFWGGLNTAVLITSSLTMALAVNAAELGKRKRIGIFLILTMLLGLVFLGVKVIEYSHKFHEHLIPGLPFDYHGSRETALKIFFSFYFAMTGMHAFHMIAGVSILLFLIPLAWAGRFTVEYNAPVEIFGLYWHFVDIVWIFLFPLLYLVARHAAV